MDTLRALRVLGLPPGATADEIQAAWRDLARVWHPDRFPHDERLRQKAGENLQRINAAHDALRDYDPAVTPKLAARVRESMAIILGMGELGDPPPSPVAPVAVELEPPAERLTPDAPIGARNSLRVLGLGVARHHHDPGPKPEPDERPDRAWTWAIATFVVLVIVAVITLLR